MLKSAPIALLFLFALTAVRGDAASYSDYCVDITNTEQYVRVVFPIVRAYGSELKFDQSPLKEMSLRGYHKCNEAQIKPFIVEGEAQVGEGITVEGDICGPFPHFVIYRAYEFQQLYPGYYRDGSLGRHPMDSYITVALAATIKRCGGKKPERLHFDARRVDRLPREVRVAAVKGKIKKAPFVKQNFYSSTVLLKNGMTIVNDDPAKEAAFLSEQRVAVNAAMRKREEDARQFAVGAALGLLLLGTAYQDCPIDDYSC